MTAVGVLPGGPARLVRPDGRVETLGAYRAGGGYRDLPAAAELLDLVEAAGLRGRGGAAFPAARKMRAVRAAGGRPVVLANGEEGEPASVKDRWLLRTRPHLVLDGVRHAAAAVGADLAYVYVSDPAAERAVAGAAAELTGLPFEPRVVRVGPAYVAGEETAAVRYVNGGPALPSDKPPRPYESGVAGRPTLVSNVETLANLPLLTGGPPGTFLLTLGGRVANPGLYELPFGTPMRTAIEALGGTTVRPAGYLMGGYFGGLLNARGGDLPLDYDALAAEGSGLGCGAVTVLGARDCPVHVAAEVMAYFDRSNAGQCGSCFNGTAAMSATLSALVAQTAADADLDRLRRWSATLRGRGACATLDGAAALAASLLREFPGAVRAHLDGSCPPCRTDSRIGRAAPFAVQVPGIPAELRRG
ncbi:MAG TPA: NADH-ubiquinone oxidoreductase-F iron-sulfur binding region domain-containing protein [Streptosporangiaceae bacterium]|jgi:NADH:ubiquinone oxidoreductase subunit F (NADH-binding)